MNELKIYLSNNYAENHLTLDSFFHRRSIGNSTSDEHSFQLKFVNVDAHLAFSNNSQNSILRTTLELLLGSQIFLIDGTSPLTFQTGVEMAFAKNWKIPIYTILNRDLNSGSILELQHNIAYRYVYELSNRVFPSLESFATYLIELDQNHHLFYPYPIIDSGKEIDKLLSFDGGYDEGYSVTSNFWGNHPASLVIRCADLLQNSDRNCQIKCLDLGCGTGKNSIYLSQHGFLVDAIDSSYWAIEEAKSVCPDVNWNVGDIRKLNFITQKYNAVLMTGSLHCLATISEVQHVVRSAQEITIAGGYNVLSAFNSDLQDLSGHAQSFSPILLSHQEYLDMYKDWRIIFCSNITQSDVHPHNNIVHKHSITRILAQKV